MDPSKSLFAIAIFAFTETICQALQKYRSIKCFLSLWSSQ